MSVSAKPRRPVLVLTTEAPDPPEKVEPIKSAPRKWPASTSHQASSSSVWSKSGGSGESQDDRPASAHQLSVTTMPSGSRRLSFAAIVRRSSDMSECTPDTISDTSDKVPRSKSSGAITEDNICLADWEKELQEARRRKMSGSRHAERATASWFSGPAPPSSPSPPLESRPAPALPDPTEYPALPKSKPSSARREKKKRTRVSPQRSSRPSSTRSTPIPQTDTSQASPSNAHHPPHLTVDIDGEDYVDTEATPFTYVWNSLFDNLNRAVDEMFYMCEHQDNIPRSEEAIGVLNVAVRDFKELINQIKVQKQAMLSDGAVAWQVRTKHVQVRQHPPIPVPLPPHPSQGMECLPVSQARSLQSSPNSIEADVESTLSEDRPQMVLSRLNKEQPDEQPSPSPHESDSSARAKPSKKIFAMSWGDMMYGPAREYERGVALHKKLSSPTRSKKSSRTEVEQRLATKQQRAEMLRNQQVIEKQHRLRMRADRITQKKMQLHATEAIETAKRNAETFTRLDKAEQVREEYIHMVRSKASTENLKVDEVQFITSMSAETERNIMNKQIQDRQRLSEQRRSERLRARRMAGKDWAERMSERKARAEKDSADRKAMITRRIEEARLRREQLLEGKRSLPSSPSMKGYSPQIGRIHVAQSPIMVTGHAIKISESPPRSSDGPFDFVLDPKAGRPRVKSTGKREARTPDAEQPQPLQQPPPVPTPVSDAGERAFTSPVYCRVCKVKINREVHIQQHLQGKRHRAAVKSKPGASPSTSYIIPYDSVTTALKPARSPPSRGGAQEPHGNGDKVINIAPAHDPEDAPSVPNQSNKKKKCRKIKQHLEKYSLATWNRYYEEHGMGLAAIDEVYVQQADRIRDMKALFAEYDSATCGDNETKLQIKLNHIEAKIVGVLLEILKADGYSLARDTPPEVPEKPSASLTSIQLSLAQLLIDNLAMFSDRTPVQEAKGLTGFLISPLYIALCCIDLCTYNSEVCRFLLQHNRTTPLLDLIKRKLADIAHPPYLVVTIEVVSRVLREPMPQEVAFETKFYLLRYISLSGIIRSASLSISSTFQLSSKKKPAFRSLAETARLMSESGKAPEKTVGAQSKRKGRKGKRKKVKGRAKAEEKAQSNSGAIKGHNLGIGKSTRLPLNINTAPDLQDHIPMCSALLDLLEAVTSYSDVSVEKKPVYKVSSYGQSIIHAVKETAISGILPALTVLSLTPCAAIVGLTDVIVQPTTPTNLKAHKFPDDVLHIVHLTLKFLNNVARLNLSVIQASSSDYRSQCYHITATLLQVASALYEADNDSETARDLLRQLLLFVGYCALLSPGNQSSMRWGHPSLLHRLSDLPFYFFSDPQGKEVLFPTLISVMYRDPHNVEVLESQVNMDLLIEYLNERRTAASTERKAADGNASSDELPEMFQLRLRFPPERVQDAIEFLRNPQAPIPDTSAQADCQPSTAHMKQ